MKRPCLHTLTSPLLGLLTCERRRRHKGRHRETIREGLGARVTVIRAEW